MLPIGRQEALNLCEPFLPRSRESAVVCLSRSFAVSLSRPVLPCRRLFVDGLVSKSVSIRPRRRAVQELETGPLHRFQDWPNEQVPSGRPASIPSGTATGGRYPSREDREAFLVEPEQVSVPTFG